MNQQTAAAEQEAAAARKALPMPVRRQAARVMFGESVSAGMPMSAHELGEAFGRSARWGRDRIAEVRAELAKLATSATGATGTKPAQSHADEPASGVAEPGHGPQSNPRAQSDSRPAVEDDDAGQDAGDGLPQLRRVRWGVRATLGLGVVASTVANVLHAQDNLISQTIAAWPPLALLATIELISRVPVHRRSLAWVRFAATATIAGIAAWVSYWHMAEVIRRYGETGESPYLIPLTVDGLVIVASVCLVELGHRIRTLIAVTR